MRRLEVRRHAPRDPDEDRLSSDGELLAEEIGRTLEGPYALLVTSPARRAAETAAWFLRGAKHPLPPSHGISEGLAPPATDRWVLAAKAAGTTRMDALETLDPDLVREGAAAYAKELRRILGDVPEGGRGLAIGHTPMLEAGVYGLTGTVIEPLRACEGVLLTEEDGNVRVEREYRRA